MRSATRLTFCEPLTGPAPNPGCPESWFFPILIFPKMGIVCKTRRTIFLSPAWMRFSSSETKADDNFQAKFCCHSLECCLHIQRFVAWMSIAQQTQASEYEMGFRAEWFRRNDVKMDAEDNLLLSERFWNNRDGTVHECVCALFAENFETSNHTKRHSLWALKARFCPMSWYNWWCPIVRTGAPHTALSRTASRLGTVTLATVVPMRDTEAEEILLLGRPTLD